MEGGNYNRGGRGGWKRGAGNRGGGSYRGGGNRGRGGGDQGSNSRRSGPVSSEDFRIGYRLLETKTNSDARDSIMFCISPAFLKLLVGEQDLDEKPAWIDMMLTILQKSFEVDSSMRAYKEQLVVELVKEKQESFLKKICIERFTEALHDTSGLNIDKFIKSLDNYLDIYYEVCTLDPFANKKLIKAIRTVSMVLKLKAHQEGVQQLARVCERFSAVVETVDKKEKEQKKTSERSGQQKERSGRMLTEEKPEDDFRDIPVHPTVRDLEIVSAIRRNKKSGAFDSVDDYLDIQFRLLREDFISTLRNGIKKYRENRNQGARRFKSGDIKVYEGFHIIQPNFGKDGLTYTVKIDTTHKMFKRMNWESSKRLIYGSLLCLSLDDFIKSFLFATIAERETDKLKKDGTIEVQFIPESQAIYDTMDNKYGPFTVVESTAYFESYTHILKGMQNIDQSMFPLSRYIVSCETEIARPAYSRRLLPSYRLDGVDDEELTLWLDEDVRNQNLNGEMLGLNDSQFSAFISALTEEFSVIQGPPGTGKTYVGLKIVKALLDNLYSPGTQFLMETGRTYPNNGSKMTKPILVVCYTNHALDQFLEGMLPFCDTEYIVRVGSRSKNEAIEQCNLRGKRSRTGRSSSIHIGYRDLHAKKERFLEENNQQNLQDQLSVAEADIVDHTFAGFVESEILYDQLHWLGESIVQSGFMYRDAMKLWLGCESTASLANTEEIPESQPVVEEQVEASGPELIDVEGDAERELQSRQLDTDDVEDEDIQFLAKINQQQKPQAQASKGKQQSSGQMNVDNEGFQTKMSKATLSRLRGEIRKRLCQPDWMSEQEVANIASSCYYKGYDITFNMSYADRWRLYRYWLWKYKQYLSAEVSRVQFAYRKLCSLSNDLRKQEDIEILKQAKVIGMTTTGAARYQHVLQQVGAPIVIVEEAAEVLEAHITTALSTECQHLILIGDHKQLKPNPTVYELAKEYHLDLSLFERMVNNGLPVKTLNIQHRMRPEVSKFMKHIYDDLSDHQSVLERQAIRGLSTPVYFFDHTNPETVEEGIMSHSNEFEANMVVELTRYLILQNYEPSEITIITMYTGQLLVLKKKMPRNEFDGVKITSVDNFQGEENTIIILSLVRSNLEGKLGFVKIENRVCVSLSRAKYGMYVFGNFDMFSRGSDLWTRIVRDAKNASELGSILNLTCVNHGQLAEVSTPNDFKTKAPAGGCKLPCGERLRCGHFCERSCHYSDKDHLEYSCLKACTRPLSPCGHPCPAKCHDNCPSCMLKKTVLLPCNHEQDVFCYEKEADILCNEPCQDSLECGHMCTKNCSQPCTTRCMAIEERECSRCGEIKELKCFTATNYRIYGDTFNKCDTPCKEKLPCGHTCIGTCYQCKDTHRPCENICGKSLACGHKCNKKCTNCTMCGTCGPCTQPCLLTCSHGKSCAKPCSEECIFKEHTKGMKCRWGCKTHKNQCSRTCEELCSLVPCIHPCTRKVKCRKCRTREYECLGVCGEPCPFMCPDCNVESVRNSAKVKLGAAIDYTTRWMFLRDCYHTLPVDLMDEYVRRSSAAGQTILCPFPDCQHPVLNTARYAPLTRAKKIGIHGGIAAAVSPSDYQEYGRRQDMIDAQRSLHTIDAGRRGEVGGRQFQDAFEKELEEVEQKVRKQLQTQPSEHANTENTEADTERIEDMPDEDGVEFWEERIDFET